MREFFHINVCRNMYMETALVSGGIHNVVILAIISMMLLFLSNQFKRDVALF